MEVLRRTISRISLAEPNIELPAEQAMASDTCKSGWLRYKTKYFTALDNANVIYRCLKRFFKWPNRFVVLTTNAVHIYKNEFKSKTDRTIYLEDVKMIVMCSDTDRYKWCIKMVPHNPEHTLLLLYAPSKNIQQVWHTKFNEYLKYRNEENAENGVVEYDEIENENPYVDIHLSEDFLKQIITFSGHRDELNELFILCGVRGNYAIRKSRKETKAVLSVYTGKELREYLIIRSGNKLALNMKVFFDDIKDLLEYYETCSLPKTQGLCLTDLFNTF